VETAKIAAAKTVMVKRMSAHMAEFQELALSCSKKELDKRLLYLQVQCIESENSENKERLDAMNRSVLFIKTNLYCLPVRGL
jgi:hypothetical protein